MNQDKILAEADRCVKCGLCLPHCPTYRLTLDEGESPRGRITLIQALVSGSMDTPALQTHLERCLVCRNCETVCPSEVRYGALIDAARELGKGRHGNRLLKLISRLSYKSWPASLLRLYQISGLQRLISLVGGEGIRRYAALLPEVTTIVPLRNIYPALTPTRGRVGLFTGCIGRLTDRPALDAAIRVLNRLGIEVFIPPDQACCGALHLHNGDHPGALALARKNFKAFHATRLDAVITVASGCGAQLTEYDQFGSAFNLPIQEISQYLIEADWPDDIELTALDKRVALHTPCTLRNVMRQESAPLQLLERIPRLTVEQVEDMGCCGAAGSHLIFQVQLAGALRNRTMESLKRIEPDIVATSNTGCSLHLRAGLRESGIEAEILHPVQLIDRQIRVR